MTPPRLITMRLANMVRVHPKQDNSRVCANCGVQVGIYPSGQAMLRRYPDAEIVCEQCHRPSGNEELAPGALSEPFESVPAKPEGSGKAASDG